MILYICLKGIILFVLFWECESKFFEIKGLKSQRRVDIGTSDTVNVIEDMNTSDPKETNKETAEDSQVIRLTNITISSQTTEDNSPNNTNDTRQLIDTTIKIDEDNITINSNELKPINATIQDNKPLQDTPVFKSIDMSTMPVTDIHANSSDNVTTVTALIISNTSTKVDIIPFSNNKHDNINVTTVSNAIPLQISTTTDDSQLDINIKMKASDDSLSIIDIKTVTKQSNEKFDSTSISNMLKKFANRFMKLMKGFFSFKRFNDDDEEYLEDKYSLYVPISEDVSRTQYNSAEKQHVNILREGTLSLLGNDRNNM